MVVQKAYPRNPNVMGVREFRPTDNISEIIAGIESLEGQKTQWKSTTKTAGGTKIGIQMT